MDIKDNAFSGNTVLKILEEARRDRLKIMETVNSLDFSVGSLAKGHDRIFHVLESLDTKMSIHGERITRSEDRVTEANVKIDKHMDDHWKQTTMNLTIIGLFMTFWGKIKGFFFGDH